MKPKLKELFVQSIDAKGHHFDVVVTPAPEPQPEEKGYGKPKQKPRKRKADDGGTV